MLTYAPCVFSILYISVRIFLNYENLTFFLFDNIKTGKIKFCKLHLRYTRYSNQAEVITKNISGTTNHFLDLYNVYLHIDVNVRCCTNPPFGIVLLLSMETILNIKVDYSHLIFAMDMYDTFVLTLVNQV
jgi:uncharacterized Fe-S radical SAM superfamily protein PflX